MSLYEAEEVKAALDKLTLSEIRESIIAEMRNKTLLTPEAHEVLIDTYTDKLAELHY